MGRIPTEKKVQVLRAVFDEVGAFNESLAAVLKAEMLRLTQSPGRSAKVFFQQWDSIIRRYPNREQLKAFSEPIFHIDPEQTPVIYENLQLIAKSFVKWDP